MSQVEQERFNSTSTRVDTPDGTMYVNIIESANGNPIAVNLHIGKAGSALRAWSQSLAQVITAALEHGCTIERIIEDISAQRSDRSRSSINGMTIRSGPEGVCYALLAYRRDKHMLRRAELGLGDDDDTERKGRSGRMAR